MSGTQARKDLQTVPNYAGTMRPSHHATGRNARTWREVADEIYRYGMQLVSTSAETRI